MRPASAACSIHRKNRGRDLRNRGSIPMPDPPRRGTISAEHHLLEAPREDQPINIR
jgi:hypothetical protein